MSNPYITDNSKDLDFVIRVNFVMSDTTFSGIFTDLINYFRSYAPNNFQFFVSKEPLDYCDIYHYHRPNLLKSVTNPAVTTIHHDLEDDDAWYDYDQFHDKYTQMDGLICLNTSQASFLRSRGIDNHRLNIIPHGYNDDLLFPKTKVTSSTPDKLTIGIASRRYGRRVKGEAFFSELAKRLDPEKICFVLIGQSRQVTAYELLNLGFEVKCFEYMPYRLIASFYYKIDILLMCSEFEGGPANLPEALATRTPIISTKIGMSTDLITEGVNGLFLSGEPDSDASMIMNLVQHNMNNFNILSQNCIKFEPSILSWRQNIQRHIDVYKYLLNISDNHYTLVDSIS
jgi:glycosyltransferase involved in cell wall biosynthesis